MAVVNKIVVGWAFIQRFTAAAGVRHNVSERPLVSMTIIGRSRAVRAWNRAGEYPGPLRPGEQSDGESPQTGSSDYALFPSARYAECLAPHPPSSARVVRRGRAVCASSRLPNCES